MGQRGQVSIMLGMMLLTFILLFAFVVNTGMLVNAKINLQNAADLAAYAGAAVQARQLNQVSFLNYEMRRQYKKLLYRYYVLGNMAMDSFPTSPGGKGPMVWSPNSKNTDGIAVLDYKVPAICIIFSSGDNYCHTGEIPKIQPIQSFPLDRINDTLKTFADKIEEARQAECIKIGKTDILLTGAWLYNTDPTYKTIKQSVSASQSQILTTVAGLGHGLGLVPKELILRSRIDTLGTYLNAQVQSGLTYDKAQALMQSVDPAKYERSIQAMLTAYYTLGPHVFEDTGSVLLDELLPSSNGEANLVAFEDIKAKFNLYAMDFAVKNGRPDGRTHQDCQPQLNAVTVGAPVPLGVKKKTDIMTYYAIRLKAKAKIMFSPFGDMELKAYAAAQPFGSRIGPDIDESAFLRQGVTIDSRFLPPNTPLTGLDGISIPNLPIAKEDSATEGHGWDTVGAVGELYTKLAIPGKTIPAPVDSDAMERGYQVGMAPNPWEVGRYNIMNDLGNDPFVRNFDTSHFAAIWAPIAPLEKSADVRNLLKKKVDELMADLPGQTANQQDSSTLRDAMVDGLISYLDQMNQGLGEDNEGFKIARLRDPYMTTDEPSRMIASTLMESDPKKVKTSWANGNDSSFYVEGRDGYSVKFVSFDSLTGHKNPTDSFGKATWTNDPDPGAEGTNEIRLIRH